MRSLLKILRQRWLFPIIASGLMIIAFCLGQSTIDHPLAAQQVQQVKNNTAASTAQTQTNRAIAYIRDPESKTNIPISREEFGEYFIDLFGADHVETYVNRRIIEMNCIKRGIEVSWQEVDAQIDEDLKRVKGILTREDFIKKVLKERYGKSLAEWRLDVIRPRLMLAKFCRDRIQVTEEDLRQIFENRYGKKVRCKIIIWPADSSQQDSAAAAHREALRAYGQITKSDADFDRVATKQADRILAAQAGEIEPIGRFSGVENDQIEKIAFSLEEGQVSALQSLPALGWIVIKCIAHLPPKAGIDFEKEKPILAKEVIERKLEKEIPLVARKMIEESSPTMIVRPRREWTPEELERATGVSARNANQIAPALGNQKK